MILSSLFITLFALLPTHLSLATPSLQKKSTVSPDGSCGGTNRYTCQGSTYGNSCSKNNKCGSSSDYSYSKLSNGCQPAYGYCIPRGGVSPDSSCGGPDGFVCIGSNFGNSCGLNNLCGRDAGYSGVGCQPKYGYCARCTTTVQPSTSTSTSFTTTTITSNPVITTTAIVSSGIITTTTITTTTLYPVSTLVATTRATTTAVQLSTPTTTATTTATVKSGTTTTTIIGANTFVKKRDAPTVFTASDAIIIPTGPPPPMRTQLSSTSSFNETTQPALFKRSPAESTAPPANSAGLSCGTVISTGFTTTTTTTTATITSLTTSTSTSTTYTTVPSSTSTVTSVIVAVSSSIESTTVTEVSTISATTSTATVVTTTFTTVPASTSVVSKPAGIYKKVVESTQTSTCTYNSYFSRSGVSIDPTNSYATARNQCAALCTSDPRCVFFFFDRFDQGGSFAECLLSDQPYDPSQINCGVTGTTLYYAGYSKQT
ncbi:hypothetical protein GJ744_003819 [Endocarpon pusillum]|uniref:Apple domain-containing protein n=1 Tax=Endocarpon pusillum TaxID=364733 RepID=A0A8H7ARE1_9EURO|nr:hypothetical protein GJ744_003819 [Endocarpon pusillum]